MTAQPLTTDASQASAAPGPVGLGSVGLGWWGGELARALERTGAGRVVSCFARNEQARRTFADQHGCSAADSFEALLADDAVEGVLLATPHSTHLPMIVAAAEAGKHVFVEKPLAVSVKEGAEAVDAARDAGIVLQVGHHRRKAAATRAVKARIDDGSLGLVHLVEATMIGPSDLTPRPGWRADPEECPLGGMTALGVHMVDNIHYFLGPVAEVYAISRRLLARGTLDDVTTLSMELESGVLATLSTSLVLPKITTIAVHGTGGSAWSDADGEEFFVQAVDERERTPVAIDPVDPVAEQMREFAHAIRTGSAPEVGGGEALEVVTVFEAARLSAENRTPVAVDEVRGSRGAEAGGLPAF